MSEVKASFDVETQIAKCADSESTRYAMNGLQVTRGKGGKGVWLAATNTRILAVVPSGGTTDQTRIIPTKAIVKGAGKKPANVELNGELRIRTVEKTPKTVVDTAGELEGMRFPQTEQVIPTVDASWRTLTIDPALLLALADGLRTAGTTGGITLFIPPAVEGEYGKNVREIEEAIPVVVANGSVGGFGLIMPCCSEVQSRRSKDQRPECERFNEPAREFTAARQAAQPVDDERLRQWNAKRTAEYKAAADTVAK